MGRTLSTRVERLESRTQADGEPVTVWTQRSNADAFTNPSRPGVVLTRAELSALPDSGPGFSVIVVRVP